MTYVCAAQRDDRSEADLWGAFVPRVIAGIGVVTA